MSKAWWFTLMVSVAFVIMCRSTGPEYWHIAIVAVAIALGITGTIDIRRNK
jgi:hypothetical protein